jgi:hypothetical protein
VPPCEPIDRGDKIVLAATIDPERRHQRGMESVAARLARRQCQQRGIKTTQPQVWHVDAFEAVISQNFRAKAGEGRGGRRRIGDAES